MSRSGRRITGGGALLAALLLVVSPEPVTAGAAPEPGSRRAILDLAPEGELKAGCGGKSSDWESLRDLQDPRRRVVRSGGVENESCLLISGARLLNGSVTASISASGGRGGLALRQVDPDHYLGLYLDFDAGLIEAVEWSGWEKKVLGTALFTPGAPPGALHELTAALIGSSVAVFLDQERILDVAGARESAGAAALLAGPLARVTAGEARAESWPDDRRMLLHPAASLHARVGAEVGIRFRCDGVGAGRGEAPPECAVRLAGGSLPPGLSLTSTGELSGAPEMPGEFLFVVEAEAGGGVPPIRLRSVMEVGAAAWPRFPVLPGTRTVPDLALLYTPDDIGQSIAFSTLGRPDDLLFRLHRDHPRLKVTIMSTPANRYISESAIDPRSDGARVWKWAAVDPASDWIELGGHGYSHSPPGDENLDHHEFSTVQSGCNVDHAKLADPSYCRRQMRLARESYRALGIPDQSVIVVRFPGTVSTPEALKAAREEGFLAVLDRGHPREAGRERWIPISGSEAILEIQDTVYLSRFAMDPELESGLESGRIKPGDMTASMPFKRALEKGLAVAERVREEGGILNITDHFWQPHEEVGGARPRYALLSAWLDEVERSRSGRIWYPFAGDLAQWLEVRRLARIGWTRSPGRVGVTIRPPDSWEAMHLPSLARASLRIALPAGARVSGPARLRDSSGAWKDLDPADQFMEGGELVVSFPMTGSVEIGVPLEEREGVRAGPAP